MRFFVSDLSMVHVHVGRVVAGHVEAQGVVARRRTSLGRFSQAGSAIREPDLQEGNVKTFSTFSTGTCILASLSLVL